MEIEDQIHDHDFAIGQQVFLWKVPGSLVNLGQYAHSGQVIAKPEPGKFTIRFARNELLPPELSEHGKDQPEATIPWECLRNAEAQQASEQAAD